MKEKKKGIWMVPAPLGGAVKEERFPHPGKPLHWWGDQPGQKGSFRVSEKSAAAGLWQTEQRETCIEGPGHLTAVHGPRCMSAGAGSWGWGGMLGAETQASEDRLRERTGVGCVQTGQRGWSMVQAATRGMVQAQGCTREGARVCH